MKYKIGDWLVFNQDCRLAFGSYIPKGEAGEITDIVDTGLTIAYRIKMKDCSTATVPTEKVDDCCEKINAAPSITKRINKKNNAINRLADTDAIKPDYYERSAMQPLEVMQRIMTAEQFEGFLLGNCIKYRMRCENKGQRDSDMHKARQYAYWLEMTKEGRIINPSKDKVPFDYEFRVV
jgi:hypothetical protein